MVTVRLTQAGSPIEMTLTLDLGLTQAVAGMNSADGVIGRAVRRAAEVTKDRIVTFQSDPVYTTRTAAREGRVGRWKTGQSSTGITVSHAGSNQYQSVAKVTPGTSYWRFQEFGTRHISAAPIFARALSSLTPADFL